VKNFRKYLQKYDKVNISIITYYEILSGLKYKDSKNLIQKFREFVSYNTVLPLTLNSVEISTDIYKNLRKTGEIIDNVDILIAGIALSNNLELVTANEKHFKRIKRLKVRNWAK